MNVCRKDASYSVINLVVMSLPWLSSTDDSPAMMAGLHFLRLSGNYLSLSWHLLSWSVEAINYMPWITHSKDTIANYYTEYENEIHGCEPISILLYFYRGKQIAIFKAKLLVLNSPIEINTNFMMDLENSNIDTFHENLCCTYFIKDGIPISHDLPTIWIIINIFSSFSSFFSYSS